MLTSTYLDMTLRVDDADVENIAYFGWCARHDFRLQRCCRCRLQRYPPTAACPWCGEAKSDWEPAPMQGTVSTFSVVHQAIQPAFAPYVPYMTLLVELDIQQNIPTIGQGIRIVGNLSDATGDLLGADAFHEVSIGTRMQMVFKDLQDGFSLPQWCIDQASSSAT